MNKAYPSATSAEDLALRRENLQRLAATNPKVAKKVKRELQLLTMEQQYSQCSPNKFSR